MYSTKSAEGASRCIFVIIACVYLFTGKPGSTKAAYAASTASGSSVISPMSVISGVKSTTSGQQPPTATAEITTIPKYGVPSEKETELDTVSQRNSRLQQEMLSVFIEWKASAATPKKSQGTFSLRSYQPTHASPPSP